MHHVKKAQSRSPQAPGAGPTPRGQHQLTPLPHSQPGPHTIRTSTPTSCPGLSSRLPYSTCNTPSAQRQANPHVPRASATPHTTTQQAIDKSTHGKRKHPALTKPWSPASAWQAAQRGRRRVRRRGLKHMRTPADRGNPRVPQRGFRGEPATGRATCSCELATSSQRRLERRADGSARDCSARGVTQRQQGENGMVA